MRIICPQCNISYEVNDTLIPEEGRKLKCSNCGEVFHFDRSGISESVTLTPENTLEEKTGDTIVSTDNESQTDDTENLSPALIPQEEISLPPTPEDNISIKDIFERLNEQSEHLFQEEQKLSFKKKFALELKTMLGLNRKFNFKIIGIIAIVLALLTSYSYRYEIVRSVPFTNIFYKMLGIKAQIPGEGLEFQNINWNYIDNNENRILEVKGFINNPTSHSIDIPTVHVELLDKDTMLLQSINQKPNIKTLKPDERIAIGIVIKTPSPTAKYVFMTFIETN